jgi:GT2 family glycosyltransferase
MELGSSGAPYVHLTNDDIECSSSDWFAVCKQIVDEDKLPAPEVVNPDGSVQSRGGALGAPANLMTEPRPDWTTVDFTTVPFMSRKQWNMIGMIPTHYCSDVWVSYRGRQLGMDTVFHCDFKLVHHNHPTGRGAGMDQGQRDAMDRTTLFQELGKHA